MGKSDGITYRQEKPQPLINIEILRVAVVYHRSRIYVFHDEVRLVVLRHAAVVDACNVGVIEACENPPLGIEARARAEERRVGEGWEAGGLGEGGWQRDT